MIKQEKDLLELITEEEISDEVLDVILKHYKNKESDASKRIKENWNDDDRFMNFEDYIAKNGKIEI